MTPNKLLEDAKNWSEGQTWIMRYDPKKTAAENWLEQFKKFMKEEYGR